VTPSEIRAIREQLGLKQAEFAPLLGYPPRSDRVSELERGVRKPGPAVTLLLILYGEGLVSKDWLNHRDAPESRCARR
jgi:DNA-binding transcriptional regulator YiaG